MYNLAAFTNFFLHFNIEISPIVMGIVVVDIIACESGDNRLSSKVS